MKRIISLILVLITLVAMFSVSALAETMVAITTQPKSVAVQDGETAKVSFTATGDGLTYTWYIKNKGASSFSKTASFTGNYYSVAMDSARDGRQLYCVVKDKYGNSVQTDTVTLYIGNSVKLTTQPKSVAVQSGVTAKVSFTATGDGLTYTWYIKNKGASSFSKTASFTSNYYSVAMDSARDGRQLYCVVKDKYGNSVQTDTVTLYIGNSVKLTTQPKSVAVQNGETAKVSFTATGDGLTYTWYIKNKGASSFSKTASFTGNYYSVVMDSARDGRQLYCVVKDKYGNSVQTDTVTLYLGNSVKLTTQPKSVAVQNGETAKVSFTATGDGLTYTWYIKNKDASSFSKTASFTGNYYSVVMDSARDGRQLYCVVKDKYGASVQTETVTLYLGNPVKLTTQPESVTVSEGKTAKVSFTATGDGLTYTWYIKNKGASSFSKTSSYTGNYYSVVMDSVRDGRRIYCVVKDKYGNSVQTDTVTLMMSASLAIKVQPESALAEIGDTVSHRVEAEGGEAPYTYQWQFMSNMQPSWLDIIDDFGGCYFGYNTSELVVNVISDHYNDNYQFRCIITDSLGNSVTSDFATIQQFVPLTIYIQPEDAYVSVGNYCEFGFLAASGFPSYTYQWYLKIDGMSSAIALDGTEGFDVQGYDTATLTIMATNELLENNAFVFCKVTDQSGREEQTDKAYILEPFELVSQTGSRSAEIGELIDISVAVKGGKAPYSYQLQRRFGSNASFVNYGGASLNYETSRTVKEEIMPEMLDMLPEYRYVITDANGERIETEPIGFWEYEEFKFVSQPANVSNVTVDDDITFSVEVTGGDKEYVYQWYEKYNYQTSYYVIDGANEPTYTRTVSANDRKYDVEFYCKVTDAVGREIVSDSVKATYTLWIKSQSATLQKVWVNVQKTLLVTPAGGSGTYTYTWEVYDSVAARWYPASSYSWIEESSVTTSMLKFTSKHEWHEKYSFRCTVSDGTKTVYSEKISMNIIAPMDITNQPSNVSEVTVGDEVSYTVKATGGDGEYSYCWYEKYNNQTEFQVISGANSGTYTRTISEEDRKYDVEIYCVVSDAVGNNVASEVVKPAYCLWIKSQSPACVETRINYESTVFATAAGGSGTYMYTWEVFNSQSNKWTSASKFSWIDESSLATDTLKFTPKYETYWIYSFRCIITDGKNIVYSETIGMNVSY